MGDPKTQRGALRRDQAWEEFKDLSSFGDEELIRESRREVIQRSRDNRMAARDDAALARWERVVWTRLTVYCVGVGSAVVLVGLLAMESELVKTGVAVLCAAIGLGFYRLRDVLRR